jgi:hypothetical protein
MFISVGFAFKSAVPDPPKKAEEARETQETQETKETKETKDYASTLLAWDLLALKEDLGRMRFADKTVAFSGYESRIYLYLASQLAQDGCQEIVELSLYSEDTAEGVAIKGVCFDESLEAPEIKVAWAGEKALAEAAGEEGQLEIDLREN